MSLDQPADEVKRRWEVEQNELKQRLITTDEIEWRTPGSLKLIGGVDISFVKGDAHKACAGFVVMDLQTREIVHEEMEMVSMTQPYIAGFLAFREVDFLVTLVERAKAAGYVPDVIMVDGNGTLHPRGFGLACHLGVLTGIPCIGVGKKFLFVDGMTVSDIKADFTKNCHKRGDYNLLTGKSGRVWGASVKPTDDVTNPIFVSSGHMLSLETSVIITIAMIDYRVPEPIRQADIRTRAYLREHTKKESKK
jgi:deoxyinosine 3'endonuclease (endonuclease V)